jgi:hypothetical protein
MARNTADAINGATNEPAIETTLFASKPLPIATKPFPYVAHEKVDESSSGANPLFAILKFHHYLIVKFLPRLKCSLTIQDSNTENSNEVLIPPYII